MEAGDPMEGLVSEGGKGGGEAEGGGDVCVCVPSIASPAAAGTDGWERAGVATAGEDAASAGRRGGVDIGVWREPEELL